MSTKITYEYVLKTLENLYKPDAVQFHHWNKMCLLRQYEYGADTRFLALKQLLEKGIDVLQRELPQAATILRLHFWEDKTVMAIKSELNFEEKQIGRIQKQGIERLANIINEQEERCKNTPPITCGDAAFDLEFRRPYISQAFGSYFASLFEITQGYIQLDKQIQVSETPETYLFPPLLKIQYLLRLPRGPKTIFISGAGGIGKTTIAIKLLKCLLSERDADIILGGSAKTAYVDIKSGRINSIETDFSSALSFYRRLYQQLALPELSDIQKPKVLIQKIQKQVRMNGYKAIIVLDNLETLDNDDTQRLMTILKPLLGRDIRALITTRELETLPRDSQVVYLNPLLDAAVTQQFIHWHIQQYQTTIKELQRMASELNQERTQKLLDMSGGIPLVMQLLLSAVAIYSWDYLNQDMPLSGQILDFLYQQHWSNLAQLGEIGQIAQQLAIFIVSRQRNGQATYLEDIFHWATSSNIDLWREAHRQLEQRFLIVRRNTSLGDFITFPSFMDFVEAQVK